MKQAGHKIEIITPHDSTVMKDIDGIPVHCLTTNGPPISTAYRLIKRAIAKDYDLYYCHELDPLLYSFVLRWVTNKPIIWDCHEYLVPMKRELQGNLSAFFTDIGMKMAATKINHIITVDNLLGKQLSKFNEVTVIPNYPTANDFPVLERVLNKKRPNFLYVGGLTRERGLKVMIEAFNIVKKEFDSNLTLVGGFYDEKLEEWAKDFDQKNNLEIEWNGWVNYKDLAPIFSKASIGLCLLQNQARYDRAIATKVFEYLVMGVPVLTSKGYLVEKLIERGRCGNTVDATNVEEVAESMMNLLKNTNLNKLGLNGLEFSREKFVWERREKNLLKVVDKLILN